MTLSAMFPMNPEDGSLSHSNWVITQHTSQIFLPNTINITTSTINPTWLEIPFTVDMLKDSLCKAVKAKIPRDLILKILLEIDVQQILDE